METLVGVLRYGHQLAQSDSLAYTSYRRACEFRSYTNITAPFPYTRDVLSRHHISPSPPEKNGSGDVEFDA